MGKKVIQVPVDETLLRELDEEAKKQHKPRAELIRTACQKYLKNCSDEEKDILYRQGYERVS